MSMLKKIFSLSEVQEYSANKYVVQTIKDPNRNQWSDRKDWHNLMFNISAFNEYLLAISKDYKSKPNPKDSFDLYVREPFVLKLRNAYISDIAVVFNRFKNIVKESLSTYYDWDPVVPLPRYFRALDWGIRKILGIKDPKLVFILQKIVAFKLFEFKSFRRKSELVVLSADYNYLMFFDHYYYNFTHFIMESYPRLYNYLQNLTPQGRHNLKIIVPPRDMSNDTNYNPWDYIEPCLAALNITEEQRVYLKKGAIVKARNLLLHSQMKLHPNITMGIKKLIDTYANAGDYSEYQKIYISRRRTTRRGVVNEDQYVQLLEKHGYKEVIMEDLDFQQKINIMQAAKVVITIDSSSATNIVFSKPHTKMLILTFKAMPLYNLFISSMYDIDLCYLICESENPANHRWYSSNMIVDIEALEKKLINWAVI